MGLLSFAKSIGKKLFAKEAEASEKISSYIEEDNPGVKNLEVTVEDGVVSLSGEADNAEALEKAVLMAGNVHGVSEVRYDGVTAPAATVQVEYYEIVSGDTLSGIAKKFYGNGAKYMQIFEANREVIKDPDKIYVGQKIRIPVDGE
jgi:nucleoid-associated protein YgaU